MTVVVVLLSVAVGFLALLVFGLLRSHAEILRALHRVGVDPAEAPQPVRQAKDVVGISPSGGTTKVSVTGADQPTLLAFLSSGCGTCEVFWQEFAIRLPDQGTRLVIVGQDPPYESEKTFAALVPSGVRAVLSGSAWQDYDVPGSPYFALVDGSTGRLLGSGTASSWGQLEKLMAVALP